jgi:MFS family permease
VSTDSSPQLFFAHVGVRSFLFVTIVARLAVVMIPIALLLTALSLHFSPVEAGAFVALYSLAAACGGPIAARMMDRFGEGSVLRVAGVCAGILLIGLTIVMPTGHFWTSLILALFLGLLTPPVGALARAIWSRLNMPAAARTAAFSLDATINELLYLVGPAMVSLALLFIFDSAALIGAGILLVVGALFTGRSLLFREAAHRPHQPSQKRTRRGLITPRFISLLTAIFLGAAFFGSLEISVAEALESRGIDTRWTGLLLAAVAVGSISGGIFYMHHPLPGSALKRYIWLTASTTIASLPLALLFLAPRIEDDSVFLGMISALLILLGLPVAAAGSEEYQLISVVTAEFDSVMPFSIAGSIIIIGLGTGSLVGGIATEELPPAGYMALTTTLMALSLVPLGVLRPRRPAQPLPDRG